MVRAVVFDFDGTLVDSYTRRDRAHRVVGALLSSYLRERGIDHDEDALLEAVEEAEHRGSARRQWDRDEWWAWVLREHAGVTDPPSDLLAEATDRYWGTVLEHTSIYPSVEAMLQRLRDRNVPIGLISDTDGLAGMKHRRIAASPLDGYVDDVVVAGEDTAAAKPAVEPFERIADLLDVDPTECVFVGDNPRTDVPGAEAAGMTTVLVDHGHGYFEDESVDPDYRVEGDSEALSELLGRLLDPD